MIAQQILDALNAARVRATYGAVAQVLGIHPLSVAKHLGVRRPEASWVVSARSGLPSGYAASERHDNLLDNSKIIRTGDELGRLLDIAGPKSDSLSAASSTVRLIGIDLAWNCEKNGSGIAIGKLEDNRLIVESVRSEVLDPDSIARVVGDTQGIRGVAIDAPLIVRNKTGSRPCEKALNTVYQRFWAGAHPTNLKTPWRSGVALANKLESQNFGHLGHGQRRWQIECYPHPAIVELFGLDKRLKYKRKKGMSTDDVRLGQISLAKHLLSLVEATTLGLDFADVVRPYLEPASIDNLAAGKLKQNEDLFDAIVCLYVAGLYEIDAKSHIFGDTASGYIYVPTQV